MRHNFAPEYPFTITLRLLSTLSLEERHLLGQKNRTAYPFCNNYSKSGYAHFSNDHLKAPIFSKYES